MKEVFVQFKSGRTLEIKDICDYVESQDFDVVISRGDEKEAHVTIFHDAVEYMSVMDDISDPDETYYCNTCAYKDRDYSYCMEIRKCNQYSGYEKEVK